MKKILLILSLILILAASFALWLFPRYTVPILMYHNIGNESGSFYVSPGNFLRQMKYLKNNGYRVITLDELVGNIRDKTPLRSRRQVVITFDDGYRDNFQYAYPVLKKFGFPATIFVVTDLVGKGRNGQGKEFASWEEINIMSQDGIAIGSHTKTHFNFAGGMDEQKAIEELVSSKRIIEEKIGLPVEYLCYPSGSFNDRTKELALQAGYKGACSTNRGFVKLNRDRYELKRIKVTNSDTLKPFSFWAKLSGYYTVFKKDKKPY
jgi:peptidoglycan/xylan/chitin deacetylase (PgdA/CDA1 family)